MLPKPENPWTEAEIAILRRDFEANLTSIQSAVNLPNRTPGSIGSARRRHGLFIMSASERAVLRIKMAVHRPPRMIGDAAFVRAMIAARRNGDEFVVIGVVKDRRPLVPTRYEPAQRASFMSSSAGLCSDDGMPRHERPTSDINKQ